MKLVNTETNEFEDVPETALVEALQSGRYGMLEGQRVDVVSSDGTIGDIDAAELGVMLQEGGRVATPEELRKHDQQVKYGGTGQQIIGGAEALARGATVGLSDLVATEVLGADPEAMRGRREELGGVATGLEIGGALAPILLSGGAAAPASGAGLAARGASVVRGVGALPRAITAVGHGAESLAARVLGTGATGLGGLAQTIAPKVLGGAVETALYSTGEVLTEEALSGGNYDRLAEKMIAHATPNALIGGAATGAFGLAGAALSKGGKAIQRSWAALGADDLTRVAEQHLGHDVPPSVGQKLKDWYAKVAGVASSSGEDAVKAGLDTRVRRLALEGSQVKERAAREVTEHVQAMADTEGLVRNAFAGRLKETTVQKLVKKGDPATLDAAAGMVREISDDLHSLVNVKGRSRFGFDGDVKGMVQWADDLDASFKGALKSKDREAKLFMGLDNTKREAQGWLNRVGAAIERQSSPAKAAQLTKLRDRIESLRGRIQSHLEDAAAWGDAAVAQAESNQAISRALRTIDQFNANTTQRIKGAANAPHFTGYGHVADTEKISRYLDSLQDFRKDQTHLAIREHLQTRRETFEAVLKHHELGPSEAEALKKAVGATKAFEKTLDETAETVAAENIFKKMIEDESRSGVGALIGIGGGALAAGPLGAAAGLALGAVTRPGHTLRQLALLEQMVRTVNARAANVAKLAVGTVAGKRATTAYTHVGIHETRASAGTTRPRKLPPIIAKALEGDPETRRTIVGEKIQELREMQNPRDEKLTKRLDEGLGDVTSFAPKTAAAAHVKARQIVTNMANKAPREPEKGLNPKHAERKMSDAQAEEFALYWAGAEAPLEALEQQVSAGELSTHTVQAVKENHPEIFSSVRNAVIEEITLAEEPPDYQRETMLARHFDIRVSPSQDPAYIASVQASYAAAPQAPTGAPTVRAAGADKVETSKDRMTEAQRMAAGE